LLWRSLKGTSRPLWKSSILNSFISKSLYAFLMDCLSTQVGE
jgi:hypothetical protein